MRMFDRGNSEFPETSVMTDQEHIIAMHPVRRDKRHQSPARTPRIMAWEDQPTRQPSSGKTSPQALYNNNKVNNHSPTSDPTWIDPSSNVQMRPKPDQRQSNRNLLRMHSNPIQPPEQVKSPDVDTRRPMRGHPLGQSFSETFKTEGDASRLTRSDGARKTIHFDVDVDRRLTQSMDSATMGRLRKQSQRNSSPGYGQAASPRSSWGHQSTSSPTTPTSPSRSNWKFGGEIYEFLDKQPPNQDATDYGCYNKVNKEPLYNNNNDDSRQSRCMTLPSSLNNKHLAVARSNFIKYRTKSDDLGQPPPEIKQANSKPPASDPTTPTIEKRKVEFPKGMNKPPVEPVSTRSLVSIMKHQNHSKKSGSISSTSSASHSTSSSDVPPMESRMHSRSTTWPYNGSFARRRSISEPTLLDINDAETHDVYTYDDDDDDGSDNDHDDYGFLSYPSFRLRQEVLNSLCLDTSAMQKSLPSSGTKSSGSLSAATEAARAIFPKKWRRSKMSSSPASSLKMLPAWKPEGSCTWSNSEGKKTVLQDTTLLRLTDKERLMLQKLALAKLQAMNLGCPITIPKDWRNEKRSKKSGFSLKRRTGSSSLLENLRDKSKEKDGKESGSGWVFGIPLGKVIANDLELRRRKASAMIDRRESFDASQAHPPSRGSSCSSVSREEKLKFRKARNQTVAICHCRSNVDLNHSPALHKSTAHGGGVSCDSLSEADNGSSKALGSSLLDALSLSSATQLHEHSLDAHGYSLEGRDQSLVLHSPKVPYIVKACCQHLENYGLHVLGIFRIGSSKKRTKQLREEFDCGREVKLGEQHNPHDVGALLKEFFRDLTDPLLTRDLYSAFIATRKLKNRADRIHAVRLLISLLPPSNRDTLWSLLKFLHTVTQHSADSIDENRQEVAGNKMDAHNLATLFGPNVLHKAKGGEFQVESLERAEERKDIIEIVKELIESYVEIFQVSAELHDEAMRLLWEASPEAVNFLLKQRISRSSLSQGMEVDHDSSSNHCEMSDSSSPTSPAITIEMDSPSHSRSFNDNVFMQPTSRSGSTPGSRRSRSSDQGHDSGHLALPEQVWLRQDRSVSPASPCLKPKTMKPATPNFSIRVTPDPSDQSLTSVSKAVASPRTSQHRSRSSGHANKPQPSSRHMLTVPGTRTKDADSMSSLSSGYYPGSSRSGTASPAPPDPHQGHKSWYLETPPDSPRHPVSDCSKEPSPSPFQRTSSTHRPLNVLNNEAKDSEAKWQEENWSRWKHLAKENCDEFQGQETLV